MMRATSTEATHSALRRRDPSTAPSSAFSTLFPTIRYGEVRALALLAGLTAIYVLAGKFSLSLAFVNASASAVWPPSGIAIAAFLLIGRAMWPAILLGAFLVNVTTTGNIATSAMIAAGNTLEGAVAALLIERYANGRFAFLRPDNVVAYCLAAIVGTSLAATIGTGSLLVSGEVPPNGAAVVWLTWWLGDLGGAIVLAPLVLVWAAYPALEWRPVRAAELLIILLGLWMTSHLLFGPWDAVRGIPIMYVTIPWLVWAAYRFGPPETATAICLLSGVAIVGTTHGYGPFATGDPNAALLVLQGFLVVLSPTILALAAGVATDRASQIALKRGHDELELRVEARTRDLEAANAALQLQIKERTEAEDRLRRSEQGLLEAERLARLGNWSWDVAANALRWSDELMRIYGVTPDRFRGSVDDFLLRLPEEDRANAERIIEQALKDHRPFDFYHRIIRPDGAQRILHARGQVVVNQAGKVLRLYGTGQDVTELKQAEAALQRANDELERRVDERTRELAVTNEQLREKVADLESFEDAVVGRELKMIQLEKELEDLKKKKEE